MLGKMGKIDMTYPVKSSCNTRQSKHYAGYQMLLKTIRVWERYENVLKQKFLHVDVDLT